MWWPVCRCVAVEGFECGDLCAGVWLLGVEAFECDLLCAGVWVFKCLNVVACVQVCGC